MLQVISEDFKLTEANKEEIYERIEKLNLLSKGECDFKVFVSKPNESMFSITIKMVRGSKLFTSSEESHDFHKALNKAKKKMVRQISDISKDHHVHDNDYYKGA